MKENSSGKGDRRSVKWRVLSEDPQGAGTGVPSKTGRRVRQTQNQHDYEEKRRGFRSQRDGRRSECVPEVSLLLNSGLQISTSPSPSSSVLTLQQHGPAECWRLMRFEFRKSSAWIRTDLVLTYLVSLSLVFSSNISTHPKILRACCMRAFVIVPWEMWEMGRVIPDPEWLAP